MPFVPTQQAEHHRREMLRLIREHHAAKGYAPTVRDLAAALDLNPATVLYHLRALARAELVTWEPMTARSLRVTAGPESGQEV